MPDPSATHLERPWLPWPAPSGGPQYGPPRESMHRASPYFQPGSFPPPDPALAPIPPQARLFLQSAPSVDAGPARPWSWDYCRDWGAPSARQSGLEPASAWPQHLQQPTSALQYSDHNGKAFVARLTRFRSGLQIDGNRINELIAVLCKSRRVSEACTFL